MKRAPQYKDIGCNPFSGRLTRSTRQMREHKSVLPNYRRLSTSTIVLCNEKIYLREMMLNLNDVCDCDEQLSWIIWVCAFCFFFGEKKKKWLLDRRLDVCCSDGCDFGVVCYCCWNRMIGLATVISVEDVQSDLLTKWSSSDSELLCMCSTKMLDVWWRLNTFAQLLQSAFPFYCLKF